jgi:Rne/Rng family ribonuclease
MAIEPKSPRKRAVKKSSKKSLSSDSSADADVVAPVAEEAPKAATKSAAKKAAAIPVPMFQAAETAAPKRATKAVAKKAAKPAKSEGSAGSEEAEESSTPTADSEDSESRGNRNRRRRRGGRGRRKPNGEGVDSQEDSDSETDESSEDSTESADGTTHRRRRRRRATGDGVTPGEVIEEDGVVTVVKVREVREKTERPSRDRAERGTRNRRDRDRDRGRSDSREYREPYRRRGTIITDGEFLARRENVDREMVVRQIGDRIQIAVIEDNVMVEHYVNRNANVSYVGNVYLGRVQNVLPSMEAAFVDIGKGRNAVLYAAEVNWDAAGISESEPRKIEMVLKTGQSVLVQVTKDPIGQKGARLTSQISLPGRYVVYVPGGEMSGISKRLPDTERSRLKAILKTLIPEDAGVIVRTAAEGVSDAELTADVERLKAQWDDLYQKSVNPNFHAPALLLSEPDLAVRVIRDIFNEDFRKLIIQGNEAWDEISSYLGSIAPELVSKIEKYSGRDLFADYRVEEQLAKAFDRKVYLPSGGSLVIDRTEAMVVIDVNTGKFIGKGGNLEETVTKNNLEAAEEIARQLRLRDLGGIVVIDFIDMILESNRDAVLRRLVESLGRDRTKHQVAEVTSLGLVQMTRKRVGQGLIEAFSTTCDSCGGRGIHVHMDPVKIKAPMPQVTSESSDNSESEEESSSETSNEVEETPAEAVVAPKGKRRRRAASSGVITA